MSEKNSTGHSDFDKEEWRDIRGFEGWYQISNCGRVKSLARVVPMSDGRTYRVRERLLKPAWEGHYFHVAFSKDGGETMHLVHRLVLEAFASPCPEGMQARHLNGDARNNGLSNLRWGTSKKNQRDRVRHGTSNRGVLGNTYKLKGKVDEIKRLRATGDYTVQEIADRYGVSTVTIYSTLRKE